MIEKAKTKLFEYLDKAASSTIREIYLKKFSNDTNVNYEDILADYHYMQIQNARLNNIRQRQNAIIKANNERNITINANPCLILGIDSQRKGYLIDPNQGAGFGLFKRDAEGSFDTLEVGHDMNGVELKPIVITNEELEKILSEKNPHLDDNQIHAFRGIYGTNLAIEELIKKALFKTRDELQKYL